MRVVIDANVAIAAAATRGLCEAVMELCIERHQIILCRGILDEINGKLHDKLRVPGPIIAEYRKVLEDHAQILNPVALDPSACRDPDDLMVLGVAVAGNADVIVTGDKDLLVLKKFKGIPIVTPRVFWETNRKPQ
jgi:uncharacterized protein